MMCHMIGCDPIGTIGLGMASEYSRIRVPRPPQKRTTFMALPRCKWGAGHPPAALSPAAGSPDRVPDTPMRTLGRKLGTTNLGPDVIMPLCLCACLCARSIDGVTARAQCAQGRRDQVDGCQLRRGRRA